MLRQTPELQSKILIRYQITFVIGLKIKLAWIIPLNMRCVELELKLVEGKTRV